MKMAEALLIRSDLQKRLQVLRGRIENSARVQEGDSPVELPTELLAEADQLLAELSNLATRINTANLQHTDRDGVTLTALLAQRDAQLQKHALLTTLWEAGSSTNSRFSRSEIKWVATVNLANVRQQIDAAARQMRELNLKIQEANWRIEL
jgi:hypothetical protein